MSIKSSFYFPSSDGKSRIHGVHWHPDQAPVAVLQITHGMIEYIERYDCFSQFLNQQGIAVIGHDHLGHGKSSKEEDFGYFGEKDGYRYLLSDIHRVSLYCRKQYPNLPHFIMGHSMGSFLLRLYLTVSHESFAGAIIMGTGNQPLPLLLGGQCMIFAISKQKGRRYRSLFLHKLVLENYNRKFWPARTRNDWLSSDREEVKKYLESPYCNFYFTCGAYEDLFQVLTRLKRKKVMKKIPVKLPVLFASGGKDPVGQQGNGVKRLYDTYRKLGVKDLEMRLYSECRHEILNERNKQQVFQDIYEWMQNRLNQRV